MAEIKLREIYKCEMCGNVVEVLYEGQPDLHCCGKPMVKLEAKTEDSSKEKHVPFVEDKGDSVLVKVGENQDHPMEEKHYIVFIEILTDKKVYRHELKPGDKPQAEFPVKKSDIISVREYCNVHNLWKS